MGFNADFSRLPCFSKCLSLSSLNKPNVEDLNVTMNISQQIILEPNNLGIAIVEYQGRISDRISDKSRFDRSMVET